MIRKGKIMGKIELSFEKLEDGTCNIFADIFQNEETMLVLTAERAKFVQVKLFAQTDNRDILLNVSYDDLKKFAKEILNI